jgi:hypothetical protein
MGAAQFLDIKSAYDNVRIDILVHRLKEIKVAMQLTVTDQYLPASFLIITSHNINFNFINT